MGTIAYVVHNSFSIPKLAEASRAERRVDIKTHLIFDAMNFEHVQGAGLFTGELLRALVALKMHSDRCNNFVVFPGHRNVSERTFEVHPENPRNARPRGTIF